MNIYLAGNPAMHEELNAVGNELESLGISVVSTWHNDSALCDLLDKHAESDLALNNHAVSALANLLSQPADNEAAQMMRELPDPPNVAPLKDLVIAGDQFEDEIASADYVVVDAGNSEMEAGYALAIGKRVILIGDTTSPVSSYFFERVRYAKDWSDAIGRLAAARNLEIIVGKNSVKPVEV